MKLVKVTYVGPLPDGRVECPKTGRSYPVARAEQKDAAGNVIAPAVPPTFTRGVEFEMPEDLAFAMEYQAPKEWRVPDSVRKAVEERRKQEAEEAKKGKV